MAEGKTAGRSAVYAAADRNKAKADGSRQYAVPRAL